MKQIAPLLLLLSSALASPLAASPFIDYPDDPGMPTDEVVEIHVAPKDLARCQATLAMVTGAPVTVGDVAIGEAEPRQVAYDAPDAPPLPVAVCVADPRPRPGS
ncbi:MAG: hypothetical protein JXQ91_12945 [Vannielia sp.]|uniref:hypothetical protein n=1 Tax=Rhodobacterales TaxID=204455 RepID=UPI0020948310|nr:hypothetical protein [Oceanicola sp. 502str15]MCO6382803.1 hypothetical protein [Oceanicola sp. 502str15]